MTGGPASVPERIERVIGAFDFYLQEYDARFPFTRTGQLDHHASTIERLGSLGNDPVAALADDVFVDSLYATLRAWGIGVRGSRLRPKDDFVASLNSESAVLAVLSQRTIWEARFPEDDVDKQVWALIERLEIVQNDAKLVALTKTLHHLLPNLIVPIDRRYTGSFFGWNPGQMQYGQRKLFFEAIGTFNRMAREVDLPSRIGIGWRSAPTKLIDNAIIAYCLIELAGESPRAPMSDKVEKYRPLKDLLESKSGIVELSFAEIDALVGGLPASARNHRPWWGNAAKGLQARAWLDAGKKVELVDILGERVRFVPAK